MRTYTVYDRQGKAKYLTAAEIIQNAKEQETSGILPIYARIIPHKNGKKEFLPAGWLIWNSYKSGCITVYKRQSDNKYIIAIGWPGEYVVM